MKMQIQRIVNLTAGAALSCVLLMIFCPGTRASSSTHRIKKIRQSVQGSRIRVVIDCSTQLPYEIVPFHNPERVAINMKKVRVSSGVTADRRISSGPVRRIRLNRLSWGTQIVLDLNGKSGWKHFRLGKTRGKFDRIVVDLWRLQAKSRSSAPGRQPIIIAVDAGHGGIDPGAKGRYNLVEKNVALDIARRLAKTINSLGGYKAVLIRDRDTFLSLSKRTEIARAKRADAFISIHLNSARKKKARGAEVFFLSPAGAAAKASKLLSSKRQTAKDLGIKGQSSDEILYMVLDVNQQTMMVRSSLLAETVLKSLRKKGFPPTRGIKQRSFAVLKSISIPSVIVEVGFISNIYDAKLLRSSKGREKIAISLAGGIHSFFKHYPPPRGRRSKVNLYKVKKGDTLWKIARKYATTISSLRKVNKLGKAGILRIGQEILVLDGRK